MHISTSDVIADQPILVIRKLLKKNQWSDLTLENTREVLNIDTETAQRVIADLYAEGYLEPADSFSGETRWRNTLKGNTLAMASAARPIRRKVAEKKVAEFLDRVQRVNESNEFVYAVAKVVIFGSYISNAPTVNDIDLALSVVPKYVDPDELQRNCDGRIKRAIQEGDTRGQALRQYRDTIELAST